MNIGIIGLGDMGSLCARKWAEKGYSVFGCDLPENYESLKEVFQGSSAVIMKNATDVAKDADFLLFSVETANISQVVELVADFVKPGTIVAGQTSVKFPEIEAFDRYLAPDIDVFTCHSLHGPAFSTVGQKLIVVPHRVSEDAYRKGLEFY